ncbi:MAG: hypothetical protein GYB31_11145 [Bacteroidetes bacterium]|nr:hypothetical protein [Bacteroidota bacterium]
MPAQVVDYVQFTVDDGLPSNHVYGVLQDHKGYLYFYTDNGISRFDGYSFTNFGEVEGLVNRDIWFMYEDADKRIWLFGSTGPHQYLEDGQIQTVDGMYPDKMVPGMLSLTENGYTVTKDDFTCKVDVDGVKPMPNSLEGISDGFFQQSSDRKEYQQFTSSDSIWIFPERELLIHHSRSGSTQTTLTGLAVSELHAPYLLEGKVYLDHAGGTAIYDLVKKQLSLDYRTDLQGVAPTRTLIIGDLAVICTFSSGVIFRKVRQFARHRFPGKGFRLIGKGIAGSKILIDEENRFWKTDKDSLHRLDLPVSTIGASFNFLQNNVFKTKDDVLLFDEYFVVHPATARILYDGSRDDFINTNGQPFNNTFLFRDVLMVDSVCWVIRNGSLLPIDFTRSKHYFIGYPGANISCVEQFQNQILAGSNNGLFKMEEEMAPLHLSADVLIGPIADLLNVEDKYLIIAGANGGIFSFDGSRLIKLDQFDTRIYEMSYSRPYLYGLTANLVFRKDLSEPNRNFERFHFYNSLGIEKVNSLEVDPDSLHLVTNNGLYIFGHEDMTSPKFEVGLSELWMEQNGIQIEANTQIPYRQNSIRFNYKLLSIPSLGEIEYEYQLWPVDTIWHRTEDRNVLFPSLAPDDYVFRVKARDVFGNRSDEESLTFSIVPPWYWRWELYLILSLLLILFFWYFNNRRLRRIQQETEMRERVKTQLAELKLQALRTRMNPHFIFNAFSAIQNAIRKLEREKADQYLTNLARLVRKYLDLSDQNEIMLDEEIELLRLYCEIEKMRFGGDLDISFNVEEDLAADFIAVPSLLVQPFVENAINHGLFHKEGQKKLQLSFREDAEGLQVEVRDNGIGRKAAQKIKESHFRNHQSKGIGIVDHRIKTLRDAGKFEVAYEIVDLKEGEKAKGTLIRIKLREK